uniref:ABC transporter domain-containing protein n=2 Tax=Ixodes scapularis TaxID=6945 RepID=A0A1S4L760_IXOSC
TLGASGGMAVVCGYDVVRQTSSARKSIGFCQQKDVFFSDLTVWEHLVYFGRLKGLREGQVSDQAAEMLQAVELEEKGDNLPHELSGGMKRRLSIALAIVSNPKVLTEEF